VPFATFAHIRPLGVSRLYVPIYTYGADLQALAMWISTVLPSVCTAGSTGSISFSVHNWHRYVHQVHRYVTA
jgi:predicted membrane-bound mannosyltransferase